MAGIPRFPHFSSTFHLAAALAVVTLYASVGVVAQSVEELTWGADAEGGAPYVEAAADDPSRVVGFDVEVAGLLAEGLGRRPRFVQAGFTTLDAAVARGDVDIALGGLEDTPARRSRLAVTVPYYEFREVLTVREADRDRYRRLADLRGRRVATLGATQAADVLNAAAVRDGFTVVTYEDDVHPYGDLAVGRIDAVVLDHILAERGVRRNVGLVNQPGTIAVGHYVALLAPDRTALRDQCNEILRAAMADGRLEAIFRRWNVWNDDQAALYRLQLSNGDAGAKDPIRAADPPPRGHVDTAIVFLPALGRAAIISLVLSTMAMVTAVVLGAATAIGRVYGGRVTRVALTAYVELIRGTPTIHPHPVLNEWWPEGAG